MEHLNKETEDIKGFIIRRIAAYRELNKDDTAKECIIGFSYKDIEDLGFPAGREKLYGLLCDMKQDGLIKGIKSTYEGYFWVIEGSPFYIRENRKYDKKKGYYYERKGRRYYQEDGECFLRPRKENYEDTRSHCTRSGYVSPPTHPIMILVDKDFKKNFLDKTQYNQINKIQITIDLKEDGIYRIKDGEKLCYGIKGGRASIVKSLKNGKKIGKILMKDCGYQDMQRLSKEVRLLNKEFISELEVEQKLVENHNNNGYYLNKVMYDIEFK